MSLNIAILIGRLTRDPELRKTKSGLSVASFDIAVDNPTGKDKEKTTTFVHIVVWKDLADVVVNYTHKGSLVEVNGRIYQKNYEDKEGKTRFEFGVIAAEVQFLEPKPKAAEPAKAEPAKTDTTIDVVDDDLPF